MSDFAHAPLTKALDLAVLVAHAFWRNSGPQSYPNYTCVPVICMGCVIVCGGRVPAGAAVIRMGRLAAVVCMGRCVAVCCTDGPQRLIWVCFACVLVSDGRASLAWRLLTGNFVMVQTSEVFFGLLLIYQVRVSLASALGSWRCAAAFADTHGRCCTAQFRFLERRMGTAKYAAFVLFALAVGWALRLYLLQARLVSTIASGPCVQLFSRASAAVQRCCPALLSSAAAGIVAA